ncbi:sulfotransferase domain-containing protein [Marinomonas balearica]|uniref:Sulfotransferase domain-containing protein n=1 Tax=Marinomonas balearica TaxID=491947 RepID=A0A4R6M5A1_9GAMM|nr:sulfotransferase domain-containing protein [Marinomonas balearica]TDO96246.1 sulfotransferase domain-containing protein [Marinomonas balearica]
MSIEQRIILSGQPRSGYALLNSIIHKIKLISGSLNDCEERQAAQNILNDNDLNLYNCYLDALSKSGYDEKDIIINGEFRSINGGPQWFDSEGNYFVRKYIGIMGKGDILITHKVPSVLAYRSDTLHSHEYPRTLLNLSKNHFHFASIRNPLDIFNSANHSINALSSEYIQSNQHLGDEESIRLSISLSKFSDLKLCEGLISHQKKYWDEFLDIKENYYCVHWEQLITDPIMTISGICEYLGVLLTLEQKASIWKSMDHKNTFLYHRHNFRVNKGVIGDWKHNLVNEHLELFKSYGFNHILDELGYQKIEHFRESDYNEKQKIISKSIRNGAPLVVRDEMLATFAFNKSNIDVSKYKFYTGTWQKNSKIERATFNDDSLFVELTSSSSDLIDHAFKKLNNNNMSNQNEHTSEFIEKLVSNLKEHASIALWGISYDFENLQRALPRGILEAENVQLYDQLEAGLILKNKKIHTSQELASFDGKVFAIPTHEATIESMISFAKRNHFIKQLIWNEVHHESI